MTKRRHWWSDLWRRVAALACGLLLLNTSPAVWSASQSASGKPTPSKKLKRPAARPDSMAAAVGPAEIIDADTTGLHGHASFYGQGFHGRRTATGERFDSSQFTAASNHFPLGTMVAVRRLDNDRCAIVKVNDRMHSRHRRRVIDVSRSVAEYLDMIRTGVVLVRVAPLKTDWRQHGAEACHAAFDLEGDCANCRQPTRLPDFLGMDGN